MSERVTEKRLKEWIKIHNDNNHVKVRLSIFNGYYHILEEETGNTVACAESAGKTWDIFYTWKSGFNRALDLVRQGKIDVNA